MAYAIVNLVVTDTNPIVPSEGGGMAAGKPFLNNGPDVVAVYPASGSMDNAIILQPGKWVVLPLEWTNVKIRTAGDTNVIMSVSFTVVGA